LNQKRAECIVDVQKADRVKQIGLRSGRLVLVAHKLLPLAASRSQWHLGRGGDPGRRAPPHRRVSVWFKQGLFEVTVTLKSEQLESCSTRAVVEIDRRAHKVRIWYGYKGRPPPELAKEYPQCDGAACFEIDPEIDGDALTGRYFTDRDTVGHMTLVRSSHQI
jgi:hypothetical protein